MRLWHYKLIPYLPKSQLLAQWRELNSIYKKRDKHILINYVYEYHKSNLLYYSRLVLSEMLDRGIHAKSMENFDNYFKLSGCMVAIKFFDGDNPFPQHHTDRYLLQCFYNLQEKYDRGQKDFSEDEYMKLEEFIKSKILEV